MIDEGTRIRPKTSLSSSYNGRNTIRKSKNNPFRIPAVADLLAGREEEQIRINEEREAIRSMTLKQRAEMLRPPKPDYLIRSSQHASPETSFYGGSTTTSQNISRISSRNASRKRPKTRGSFFITNRQLINGDFQFDDGFEKSEKYVNGQSNSDQYSSSGHKTQGGRIT